MFDFYLFFNLNFSYLHVEVKGRVCHDPTGAAEEDDSDGGAGSFGWEALVPPGQRHVSWRWERDTEETEETEETEPHRQLENIKINYVKWFIYK